MTEIPTLKKYLAEFGDPDTYAKGYAVCEKLLSEKIRKQAVQIKKLEQETLDLHKAGCDESERAMENQDKIDKLKKFVKRVFEECEYDIEVGKKHPNLVVPSDLCIWDLHIEAKKLLNVSEVN